MSNFNLTAAIHINQITGVKEAISNLKSSLSGVASVEVKATFDPTSLNDLKKQLAKDINVNFKLTGTRAVTVDKLSKSVSGLQSSLNGLNSALIKSNSFLHSLGATALYVSRAINQLTRANQSMASGVNRLTISGPKIVSGNNGGGNRNNNTIVGNLGGSGGSSGNGGIQKLNKDLRQAYNVTGTVNKQFSLINEEIEQFGKLSGVLLKRFAGFTIASSAIFAVGRSFTNAISEAVQFQHELVKIGQTTELSTSSLTGLKNEITSLSKDLGVSSLELLKSSKTLAQAGLPLVEVQRALQSIAKASLAPSFKDVESITHTSISIMKQFGFGAKDLERALGQINVLSRNSAIEAEELSSAIRRAGSSFNFAADQSLPAAKKFEQFLSIITAIKDKTGEQIESIATGFKTISARIQRPEFIQALKRPNIGIDLEEDVLDASGKKTGEKRFIGAFKAIEKIQAALFKNGNKVNGNVTTQLIQELGGFRELEKTIPLLKEWDSIQRNLAEVGKSNNSLNEDMIRSQESLQVQFKKTSENFKAFVRELTETDSFKATISTLNNLANGFILIASSIKPVIPLLTAFAGIKLVTGAASYVSGISKGLHIQSKSPSLGFRGYNKGGYVDALTTPGELIFSPEQVQKIGKNKLDILNNTGRNTGIDLSGATKVPGVGNSDTVHSRLKVGSYVIKKRYAKGGMTYGDYVDGSHIGKNEEQKKFLETFHKKIDDLYTKLEQHHGIKLNRPLVSLYDNDLMPDAAGFQQSLVKVKDQTRLSHIFLNQNRLGGRTPTHELIHDLDYQLGKGTDSKGRRLYMSEVNRDIKRASNKIKQILLANGQSGKKLPSGSSVTGYFGNPKEALARGLEHSNIEDLFGYFSSGQFNNKDLVKHNIDILNSTYRGTTGGKLPYDVTKKSSGKGGGKKPPIIPPVATGGYSGSPDPFGFDPSTYKAFKPTSKSSFIGDPQQTALLLKLLAKNQLDNAIPYEAIRRRSQVIGGHIATGNVSSRTGNRYSNTYFGQGVEEAYHAYVAANHANIQNPKAFDEAFTKAIARGKNAQDALKAAETASTKTKQPILNTKRADAFNSPDFSTYQISGKQLGHLTLQQQATASKAYFAALKKGSTQLEAFNIGLAAGQKEIPTFADKLRKTGRYLSDTFTKSTHTISDKNGLTTKLSDDVYQTKSGRTRYRRTLGFGNQRNSFGTNFLGASSNLLARNLNPTAALLSAPIVSSLADNFTGSRPGESLIGAALSGGLIGGATVGSIVKHPYAIAAGAVAGAATSVASASGTKTANEDELKLKSAILKLNEAQEKLQLNNTKENENLHNSSLNEVGKSALNKIYNEHRNKNYNYGYRAAAYVNDTLGLGRVRSESEHQDAERVLSELGYSRHLFSSSSRNIALNNSYVKDAKKSAEDVASELKASLGENFASDLINKRINNKPINDEQYILYALRDSRTGQALRERHGNPNSLEFRNAARRAGEFKLDEDTRNTKIANDLTNSLRKMQASALANVLSLDTFKRKLDVASTVVDHADAAFQNQLSGRTSYLDQVNPFKDVGVTSQKDLNRGLDQLKNFYGADHKSVTVLDDAIRNNANLEQELVNEFNKYFSQLKPEQGEKGEENKTLETGLRQFIENNGHRFGPALTEELEAFTDKITKLTLSLSRPSFKQETLNYIKQAFKNGIQPKAENAADAFEKMQKPLANLLHAFDQGTQLLINAQNKRIQAELAFAEKTTHIKELFGESLSIAEHLKPEQDKISELTGGVSDPTKIGNLLQQEILKKQETLKEYHGVKADDSDNAKRLLESIRDSDIKIDKFKHALDLLARSTTLLTQTQNKLARIENVRTNQRGFLDRLTKASLNPQDAFDLHNGISGAAALLGHGQINSMNFESGKQLLDQLSSLIDDPELKKRVDAHVSQQQVKFLGLDKVPGLRGIIDKAVTKTGDSTEEKELKKALEEAAKKQLEAATVLSQDFGGFTNGANIFSKAVDEFSNAITNIKGAAGDEKIPITGMAGGGFISGTFKGGDSELTNLTPGEFVVKRSVAQKNKQLLMAINSGRAYAEGGEVLSDQELKDKIHEDFVKQEQQKAFDKLVKGKNVKIDPWHTDPIMVERRKAHFEREKQRELNLRVGRGNTNVTNTRVTNGKFAKTFDEFEAAANDATNLGNSRIINHFQREQDRIRQARVRRGNTDVLKHINKNNTFDAFEAAANDAANLGNGRVTNHFQREQERIRQAKQNRVANAQRGRGFRSRFDPTKRFKIRSGEFQVPHFAMGGGVDSELAAVTPGEFVVRKDVAEKNRPLLEHLNSGKKLARFANGGTVGGVKDNSGGFGVDTSAFTQLADAMKKFDTAALAKSLAAFTEQVSALKGTKIQVEVAPITLVHRGTVEVIASQMESQFNALKEELSKSIKQHINPLTGETKENFQKN